MTAAAVIAAILVAIAIWLTVSEHIADRRPNIHPHRLTNTGVTTKGWAAQTVTGYALRPLHPRPLDRNQRLTMANRNTKTTSYTEWVNGWESDPRSLTGQIIDRVAEQAQAVYTDTLNTLSKANR